jgi:anti-sigma factor RsiW
MNLEQQLKLQAWVDGELPEAEARQMADFVQEQGEAQTLVGELRMTRGFLAGNEPEAKLPDSGDFYWSKIQRQIEREEKAAARASGVSWTFAWRRLMAPISGVALIAFLSVLSLNVNVFQRQAVDDGANSLVEVENLSEHVGSISYRSQSENMFVVYLYTKDQEAENDPEAEPTDDTFLQ